MKLLQSIINWYFKQRHKKLEYHYTSPLDLQQKTFQELLEILGTTNNLKTGFL